MAEEQILRTKGPKRNFMLLCKIRRSNNKETTRFLAVKEYVHDHGSQGYVEFANDLLISPHVKY